MNLYLHEEKYYKSEDLEKGIDGFPPISQVTLRNLRMNKKIKYTKFGRECIYKRSWILEYLEKNTVEVKN
ncbi:hypothetical protein [Aliarcobacter butzleri]|uniref:hypothetical protein n=1 Tax=Aliarcobacter butzleri TaxID=28197 RepID=UPI002B24C2A6|nr:hypothetical protein [Aliarcobacter butzleri]